MSSRVGTFFSVHHTKTGKNDIKIFQMAKKWPNGYNLFQMILKLIKNLYSKPFQSIPKFGFLVCKIYHLATPTSSSDKQESRD
jgi:hypothetical protein